MFSIRARQLDWPDGKNALAVDRSEQRCRKELARKIGDYAGVQQVHLAILLQLNMQQATDDSLDPD
jgi:hypothetical protein